MDDRGWSRRPKWLVESGAMKAILHIAFSFLMATSSVCVVERNLRAPQ